MGFWRSVLVLIHTVSCGDLKFFGELRGRGHLKKIYLKIAFFYPQGVKIELQQCLPRCDKFSS